MDSLDIKALSVLMRNGRATWSELAAYLGLSGPATAERVRRLEEQGVIKGYAALVQSELVGYEVTAFVSVSLARPQHREQFLHHIDGLVEVQECHHVTGEEDYLLKIRCRNTRDLERVVSDELKSLPGVTKTKTTVVLSTPKETPAVPLPIESSPSEHE